VRTGTFVFVPQADSCSAAKKPRYRCGQAVGGKL